MAGGVCRRCGYAMTPDDLHYLAARQREGAGGNGLDEIHRNGGRLVEDREQNPKDLLCEPVNRRRISAFDILQAAD